MRPLPPEIAAAIARAGDGLVLLAVHCGTLDALVPALAAMRELRFHLPDARIEWACDDAWSALLGDHPDLDAVHPVPVARFRRALRSPSRWSALLREAADLRARLRGSRPGAALVLDGTRLGGLLARGAAAPVRIGTGRFATHRVPREAARGASPVEAYRPIVRVFGVPEGPIPLAGLRVPAAARRAARRVLRGAGRPGYAVIRAGPPAPLLVAAARAAASRGLAPVFLPGASNAAVGTEVLSHAGEGAVLAPALDLPALVALLSEARLFVGGDSTAMRLACGVGCPVVALRPAGDLDAGVPWGPLDRVLSPPDPSPAKTFVGLPEEAVSSAVDGILDEASLAESPARGSL